MFIQQKKAHTVQASGWSFRKRPSLHLPFHSTPSWYVLLFCCFVRVCLVRLWPMRIFTTSTREVLRYKSVKRASFYCNFVVATVVFHKAGPLPYTL